MFNGANTNVQERFKALDVVQNMKERYHEGNCNVAIVGRALVSQVLSLPCSLPFFQYLWLDDLSIDWMYTFNYPSIIILINLLLLYSVFHSLKYVADEGKLQSEGPSAEFWALFGGFAPIGGKKVSSDDDIIPEKTPPKLYWYNSILSVVMFNRNM